MQLIALGLARAGPGHMRLADHLVALGPTGTTGTMGSPCLVVANNVMVGGDTRRPTDTQPAHWARLLAKVAIARRKVLLARRVAVLDLRRLRGVFGASMVCCQYLGSGSIVVVVGHLARHHGMMYRNLLLPLLLRLLSTATSTALVDNNMPRRQILRQGMPATTTPRLLLQLLRLRYLATRSRISATSKVDQCMPARFLRHYVTRCCGCGGRERRPIHKHGGHTA